MKKDKTSVRYKSLEYYNTFCIQPDNVGSLKGCFIKDNTVGQISLSSFSISIKSLVSDFGFVKNLKLSQWTDMAGFMKKQIDVNHEQPKQLIDIITTLFNKKALRD